jgi:hypothetical protein
MSETLMVPLKFKTDYNKCRKVKESIIYEQNKSNGFNHIGAKFRSPSGQSFVVVIEPKKIESRNAKAKKTKHLLMTDSGSINININFSGVNYIIPCKLACWKFEPLSHFSFFVVIWLVKSNL